MFDYEDPSRFMYGALKGCVFIKMQIFSPRLGALDTALSGLRTLCIQPVDLFHTLQSYYGNSKQRRIGLKNVKG